jgi:hypothetical protein
MASLFSFSPMAHRRMRALFSSVGIRFSSVARQPLMSCSYSILQIRWAGCTIVV